MYNCNRKLKNIKMKKSELKAIIKEEVSKALAADSQLNEIEALNEVEALNEELMDVFKFLGRKAYNFITGLADKYAKSFFAKEGKWMNSAISKGLIDEPTEDEMKKVKADGEKDHYRGKLSGKNKKLVYITGAEMTKTKGASGIGGHTFGGGAGM